MKRLLLIILYLLALPTFASHIVGGEFEFVFKGYNGRMMRYSLNMILYFDLRNGDPGARDESVSVRIFRKSDNAVMRNALQLYLREETNVEYFQPECSSGQSIQTNRIYYSYRDPFTGAYADIELDPSEFSDPGGYYISWERCCRNYSLTNIFSENPQQGIRNAGQTFYLEFPPLQKNGQTFVNSSPRLFQPLADYACPNRVYYVDFSGFDDDGDSLVYSMVTPLTTHFFTPFPPGNLPLPAPYDSVSYRSGFGSSNIMKGSPDLKISRDGILTVTPTVAGLFAFAVRVSEYRNGEKIGEVRRDFQMLVLTSCPVYEKPVIEGKNSDDPETAFNNNVTINTNDLCFDVRVSDPDSRSRRETVTISAFLVNDRRRNITSQIVQNPTQVLENGQPATFTLCFPECPMEDEPHVVGIIVSDKACPLPQRDTLYVTVNMVKVPNQVPQFDKEEVNDVVTEGLEIPAWKTPFTGTDPDHDKVKIYLDPRTAFDPADYGFTLVVDSTQSASGFISAQLNWDTRCDVFDFSKKTDFVFSYILEDLDKCDDPIPDTITFDLLRDFKDFHYPEIYAVDQPGSDHITFDQKIYETLSFPVEALDVDKDMLDLFGRGVDFSMDDVGASFPSKTFKEKGQQTFAWRPDCSLIDLNTKDQYDFLLMVTDDDNICHYSLTDTLFVTVNVLPPDNTPPQITIDGSASRIQKTVIAGDALVIPVQGTDADRDPDDLLTLTLVDAVGPTEPPQNFTFDTSPARRVVDGVLSWTPNCEVFTGGVYETDYTFTFRVNDDRCFSAGQNELTVDVHIKDRENIDAEFNPRPNVVSSNGDGLNDFFGMYKLDENGNLVSILPVDNCEGRFVEVFIYNRWGRKVFVSSDREFKWYPTDVSTGVYFYNIKYSNREYNGSISVIGNNDEASK